MRFRKPGFIVAVFGVLFFAGFVNAQVVIFSEDFEGSGGLLNGTAEDISGAVFAANHFATTNGVLDVTGCLLYTSPSPRDQRGARMPSSA